MKYVAFALLIAALIAFAAALSTSAIAGQRVCPNGGYCPPGTCAQFNGGRTNGHGGSYACNVKNCSAANCMH